MRLLVQHAEITSRTINIPWARATFSQGGRKERKMRKSRKVWKSAEMRKRWKSVKKCKRAEKCKKCENEWKVWKSRNLLILPIIFIVKPKGNRISRFWWFPHVFRGVLWEIMNSCRNQINDCQTWDYGFFRKSPDFHQNHRKSQNAISLWFYNENDRWNQ